MFCVPSTRSWRRHCPKPCHWTSEIKRQRDEFVLGGRRRRADAAAAVRRAAVDAAAEPVTRVVVRVVHLAGPARRQRHGGDGRQRRRTGVRVRPTTRDAVVDLGPAGVEVDDEHEGRGGGGRRRRRTEQLAAHVVDVDLGRSLVVAVGRRHAVATRARRVAVDLQLHGIQLGIERVRACTR